jgi:SAM-dependent methyltransferase
LSEHPCAFDEYADRYEDALQRGLAVSGESSEYFARGRIAFLAEQLRRSGVAVARVMDFGCGTGVAIPFLRESFRGATVIGLDVSTRSLAKARAENPGVQFFEPQNFEPRGDIDLVYCNGVFHHIPLPERASAVQLIRRALRPGGVFALWENNPWNPGTQWVMSRIPFDRDAIKLSPPGAQSLVTNAGFAVRSVDFLFFFPKLLQVFRPIERYLHRLPLGAQYQVLAERTA